MINPCVKVSECLEDVLFRQSNEDRIEFILPVVKNLNGKNLTSIRIKDDVDFKRQGQKPTLDDPPDRLVKHPITVNWYPKIQSQQSKGVTPTDDVSVTCANH